MGEYVILIEGHGIHDNKRDNDADAIAARALGELRDAGHVITNATFTVVAPVAAKRDGSET